MSRGFLNKAAFELHQAVERYITAYLLVKTGYRPKTHDLQKLYERIVGLDDSFSNWFNFSEKDEQENFELLKRAYVDARYSNEYQITKAKLGDLETKVLELKNLVMGSCNKLIR